MVRPRHNCALCHSRKPEDDFPLTTSGTRALATCTRCLEQSLRYPGIWADLLLQPPRQTVVGRTDNLGTDLPSTTPPNTAARKRKRRRAAGSWPYKSRKRAKAVPKPPPKPQSLITRRIPIKKKSISAFAKKAATNLCYDPDNSETDDAPCKFCYRAGEVQCKDCYRRGVTA